MPVEPPRRALNVVDTEHGHDIAAPPRVPENVSYVIRGQLPKHPEYVNESRRLGSFTNWPEYIVQRPRDLAKAGFYYVGM